MRVTGHLWQGRFSLVAMDEAHLVGALRYVALNPVRAKLTTRPEDWHWSSTAAHIAGEGDRYVDVAPAVERVGISRRSWAQRSMRRWAMPLSARPRASAARSGRRNGSPIWKDAPE
jgi:hypothetical protein